MLFSLRRKAPKDQSINFKEIYTHLKCINKLQLWRYAMLCIAGQYRDAVSDSYPSAGKCIPTARKVLQCSRSSHRPPLPVRELRAAGRPAPAGARRAPLSAVRYDIQNRGGGPRITRAPRAWMPSFIAAIEPRPAAQTVKPEACSSFDAFLSVKKSMRSLLSKGEEMCFSH